MAALDAEFYRHYAGLKDDFELEPIYERYADLMTLEACDRLRSAAELGSRGERELWRFACEGYIGNLTRPEAETVARLEASLTAEVDAESLPYRMVRPAMANEPDRNRRERLDETRTELADEHLNPHHVTAAEKRREACPRLGAPTYTELYDRFGFRLDELAEQAQRFLSETEDLYVALLDPLVRRRIGFGLEEARRWDVPRLFRAPEWDERFPGDAMLPALTQTLAELGIDLRSQENVVLDVEARPKKSPRAFCAPIEIPDRVVLVIQPVGGPDDWHALFHEAGHAEHFAHTSAELRVEERRLGDAALGEGWAMLLELLVNDPAWLARRLDFGRADEFASEGAAMLLYLVRRYAGKFLYELELNGAAELTDMPARYVELMREATKIEPSPIDYLADVDAGFYSSSYLRAWAFESRLRAFLREQFGYGWLATREAGSLLRELWTEGQRMTADEILHEVAGAELELDAVAERVKEAAGA
jgi:oligoendopeptidase F